MVHSRTLGETELNVEWHDYGAIGQQCRIYIGEAIIKIRLFQSQGKLGNRNQKVAISREGKKGNELELQKKVEDKLSKILSKK